MSVPVAAYEVLYRETRNPLFVWEALECCQRDEPLPGWIFDYLMGATRAMAAVGQPAWDPLSERPRDMGVLDLADAVCRKMRGATTKVAKRTAEAPERTARRTVAAKAAERTARALGFLRGAQYNAFSRLEQLRREFGEALYLDLAPDGPETEARLEKIRQSYTDKRKAGGTPGQIRRRAERSRRLWNAQDK